MMAFFAYDDDLQSRVLSTSAMWQISSIGGIHMLQRSIAYHEKSANSSRSIHVFKWLAVLDVMKVGQLYLGSHRDFSCLCGILIVVFQILFKH